MLTIKRIGLVAVLFAFFSCSKGAEGGSNEPKKIIYSWNQFVMGVDLSYVNIVESSGAVFKENNQQKDPFVILKNNGTNLVRVRLWHNPTWQQSLNGGKYYSNLPDVEQTIRRAKAQGMAVNLDIHYSDTWADPDHQDIPATWKGLPLNTLADSVYNYTLATLQYLGAKNLAPEMVQVGNETNSGMLWPTGKTTAGWNGFATLLKAGIKAVRDFSNTSAIKPRIILHVAQLQNAAYWAQQLKANGVTDYDVLGLSHYYKWTTVHDFTAITQGIANLRTISGKDVMIVETAFPFTNNNADSYNNIFWESTGTAEGFPFSPKGQYEYYKALTKAIIAGGGKGIMVWEPAWVTSRMNDGWGIGSSWENNAFFEFDGNLHQGIQFMTFDYGL
jgi:arabinogalactan endo-1,4-beta-galactosidase